MRYAAPARLADVALDSHTGPPTVFLMQLPDGTPHVLRDSAALIWTIAAAGEADVAGCVSQSLDVPAEEIAEAVSSYLAELVSRGLLEVVGEGRQRPVPR